MKGCVVVTSEYLRTIAIIASSLFMCSCAAKVNQESLSRQVEGQDPEIGEKKTVSVGDVLFKKYKYNAATRAFISNGYVEDAALYQFRIPVGSYLVGAEFAGFPSYCTVGPVFYTWGKGYAACFRDSKKSGYFDEARLLGTLGVVPHDVKVPYEIKDIMLSGGGFKYELLYQGIENNSIKVSYREYVDSLARPAFQQDVTYTLARSGQTEIAFKGIEMIVYQATNKNVTYRVVSAGTEK